MLAPGWKYDIFPCISRYVFFYFATIPLLALWAREKLCADTQYTFPVYQSEHISGMMPGRQQKEKGEVSDYRPP